MPPPPTRTRLGQYEILARLAMGGMAELFLARELGPGGLERVIVLKRLLPHLAADPEFVDLFLQEARVVARLAHPNIVQIHALGELGGSWYIAMEYVPGLTVRQLTQAIEPDRMPLESAIQIVLEACAGAHAAHELVDGDGHTLGIVHRDISPHNLMVDDDGHVRLLDFGIAKPTASSEATKTGGVKGKIHYLSPEQARQEPLDRRSDVFALGIVLWELLAGTSLFRRSSDLETLQAIDKGAKKDLRKVRPEVPVAIAQVVDRALAVNRDDRYPTAEALRRALLQACHECALEPGRDALLAWYRAVVGPRREAEQAAIQKLLRGDGAVPPDLSDRFAVDFPENEARTVPEGHRARTTTGGAATRAPRRPLLRLAAGAIVAIALVSAGIWAARRPAAPTGEPIRIGFPPTLDPSVMGAELEPLRLYLERVTHRPFVFNLTRSYDELAKSLVSGDVGFAAMPAYLFLKVTTATPGIEPLVLDLFDGSAGNNGVFLVPETSNVQSVADLKAHRLCLIDLDSTTGYILPRAALRLAGLDPDKDVVTRLSGNHLQAMRDLSTGLCDAAGTYDKAYLAADRAGVPVARMRVLAITGTAPNDAVCAGPKTSPKDRSLVRNALLGFEPSRDIGTPLLGEVQRISGYTAIDLKMYERLRLALGMAAPTK